MGLQTRKIYEFSEFRLVTEDGTLWRGTERIAVTQKAVEMLTFLLENSGRVVSRDEILENVWPDTYVDENNLSVTVSMLRKAFGESAENAKLIETIPRKGYRFNGDVDLRSGEIVVSEREYTRSVIESTEIDVEVASHALSQLQTGSRRQNAVISILAAGLIILTAAVAWMYTSKTGPFAARTVYSVAVMPLRDLTGNDTDRWIAYGVTDSVIAKLSGLRGLSVRPMSSVAGIADGEYSAKQIGKRLGVDAILEGSIQRSGETYRISVQVVSTADEHVIWANTLEQSSSQIFEFQRLISSQVANALEFKLTDLDKDRLRQKPTENAEAYREFLLGRFFLGKRTYIEIRRSIQNFERAIELDPKFADAYASLATAYMLLSDSSVGAMPPNEGFPKAIEFATKAISIDETLAEAHAVLGNTKTGFEWQLDAGERDLRTAVRLNPSDAIAHLWLGWNLIAQRRFYEADEALSMAERLDPTSLIVAADRGYAAFFAADHETAIRHFQAAVDRDASFPASRFNLARAFLKVGRIDDARLQLDALTTMVPNDAPVFIMLRGCILARSGKMSDAQNDYVTLKDRRRDGEFISPNFTATLAAELGEIDDVFDDLESLVAERNEYVPYLRSAPEFEKFRTDARFNEILQKAGV